MIICSECQLEKSEDEFYKRNDGTNYYKKTCKSCFAVRRNFVKNKKSEYDKQYYILNKKRIDERTVKYQKDNPEKVKETRLKIYDKILEKRRIRYKTDINYKIRVNLRNRTKDAIRRGKGVKLNKSLDFLGCSLEFVKNYLESKFTAGMTWEKFLKGEIHIDHIKPCSSFDLTDVNQQKECFHYSNIQPLWAKENLSKNDRYL